MCAPIDRLREVSIRLGAFRGLEVLASAATGKNKQRIGTARLIRHLGFTNQECAVPGFSLSPFSLFIRYDGVVGNARTCVVSFVDSTGIRHSVEVGAESLYEAAALAVREFRRHPWVDDVEPGTVTPLSIKVKTPATTHEVSIQQLQRWTSQKPA